MAYPKLKEIVQKYGIEYVARSLDMPESVLEAKIGEFTPLYVEEAKLFRKLWAEDQTLEVLLESDGVIPSEEEKSRASVDSLAAVLREVAPDDPEVDEIIGSFHEQLDDKYGL